jgi:predicted nucleotidyltransferase
MKIAGIVAEYNPFHNGHALMIQKTRDFGFSHIAVVMSGNYTQRGEAACMLKAGRARAALMCGADLVLELPLPWAVSSAESFAFGAVSLLDSLNCIDTLSFGSECGDINRLTECASRVLELNGSAQLSEQLAFGYSFPKARSLALGSKMDEILKSPNDTLGVEYIKALKKTGSAMKPFAIKRQGTRHDGPYEHSETLESSEQQTASASGIRSLLSSGRLEEAATLMPEAAAGIFADEISAQRGPFIYDKVGPLILSQLRRMDINEISRLPDVSEGLEFRIARAVKIACSLEELYTAIKSKRYTLARIRRIVLCAFLGIDRSFTAARPPYVRVLGFNTRGAEILRVAKKAAVLPILTRHADFKSADDYSRRIYTLECRATDLYGLCLPSVLPCGCEQKFETICINS